MRRLKRSDSILLLNRFDRDEQNLKDKINQRILSRCEADPQTNCIIYVGSWTHNGQAVMRVNWRTYTLTKIVCWINRKDFLLHGRRVVLRTCDSPACVNFDHMAIISSAREAAKIVKPSSYRKLDRQSEPQRSGIDSETRERILRYYEAGLTLRTIASLFKTSYSTVRTIVRTKQEDR